MTIKSAQVTVTNVATQLVASDPDWDAVQLYNTGSVSVYLGDATVTSSTGFELPAGKTDVLNVYGAETLYGITASGSAVVDVLRTQVGA